MTYDQALKDWKKLWKIGPACDMTGGYVDQHDLDKLLKSPTRKTATECLESQIDYWFTVGPDTCGAICELSAEALVEKYPSIRAIAERHCAI